MSRRMCFYDPGPTSEKSNTFLFKQTKPDHNVEDQSKYQRQQQWHLRQDNRARNYNASLKLVFT